MKKAIAIVLCVLTVAAVFCSCGKKIGSEKKEALKYGDYEYVMLDDGTAKITKYTNVYPAEELELPRELGEEAVTVTIIGESAFENCNSLGYVKFPSSITSIEARAFAGSSIKNAIMVSSRELKYIGDEAFANCANLVQVDIPRGVEQFGNAVFYNDANLNIVSFRGNTGNLSESLFTGVGTFTIWTYEENDKVIEFGKKLGMSVKML